MIGSKLANLKEKLFIKNEFIDFLRKITGLDLDDEENLLKETGKHVEIRRFRRGKDYTI